MKVKKHIVRRNRSRKLSNMAVSIETQNRGILINNTTALIRKALMKNVSSARGNRGNTRPVD